MPTYEYQCKTCGATMDVFQSITAKPLSKVHCDRCASVRPAKRLIGTGGAVLFKGGGFYQTDYRSEGYKAKAKSESGGSGSTSDKAASDAKTADSSKTAPSPSPASTPPAAKPPKKKPD